MTAYTVTRCAGEPPNYRRFIISGDFCFPNYFDTESVDHHWECAATCNGNIVGYGLATVYKPNTLCRYSQWGFVENCYRELYIDMLWAPTDAAKGSIILAKLVDALRVYRGKVQRNNVYLVSHGLACGFYHSQGFEEIITPSHPDDEDYVDVYEEGTTPNGRYWYALPLGSELDGEQPRTFNMEHLTFIDALCRRRIDLFNMLINFKLRSYRDLEYIDPASDIDTGPAPNYLQPFLQSFRKMEDYNEFEDIKQFLVPTANFNRIVDCY